MWHEVRHPRGSKQHDKCHTKNGTADHDRVSSISQTSSSTNQIKSFAYAM
jgi:hypothetical protein